MMGMDFGTIEEALTSHQRHSVGMTGRSPDTCNCGARIMPIPHTDYMDIMERRDAAFAQHQSDEIRKLGSLS